MGMVDTARSVKLKMKHFIIPLFKLSFLQTNATSFKVPTFFNLCLSSLLGSLLLVPLFLLQRYSVHEVFPTISSVIHPTSKSLQLLIHSTSYFCVLPNTVIFDCLQLPTPFTAKLQLIILQYV